MQPADSFWDGMGTSIGNSPGWMVVAAILVIGVLFIIAKYIQPSRERVKMRELDIREREAENEAENIKVRASMSEQMSGLRVSNDNLATQSAVMFARLDESAQRSHEMGSKVNHIDDVATNTYTLVKDINSRLIGREIKREITD